MFLYVSVCSDSSSQPHPPGPCDFEKISRLLYDLMILGLGKYKETETVCRFSVHVFDPMSSLISIVLE